MWRRCHRWMPDTPTPLQHCVRWASLPRTRCTKTSVLPRHSHPRSISPQSPKPQAPTLALASWECESELAHQAWTVGDSWDRQQGVGAPGTGWRCASAPPRCRCRRRRRCWRRRGRARPGRGRARPERGGRWCRCAGPGRGA